MEVADVRKGVHDAMNRARRQAAERRARADRVYSAFEAFLERTAAPLARQIANVLRAEGYLFNVFTPSGSVRLISERTVEDFIEITLDAAGDVPRVVGRISRSRGRQVLEAERIVGSGDPETITERDLFVFLMKELEALLEK